MRLTLSPRQVAILDYTEGEVRLFTIPDTINKHDVVEWVERTHQIDMSNADYMMT